MNKFALVYIQSLLSLFESNKGEAKDPKHKATKKLVEAAIAAIPS